LTEARPQTTAQLQYSFAGGWSVSRSQFYTCAVRYGKSTVSPAEGGRASSGVVAGSARARGYQWSARGSPAGPRPVAWAWSDLDGPEGALQLPPLCAL